jgi:hypothetical protein
VWTWKTGELKSVFDANPSLRFSAMQDVPGHGILVGIRPQTTDILPSIKGDRDVALEFQGLRRIVTEKVFEGYGNYVIGGGLALLLGLACAKL